MHPLASTGIFGSHVAETINVCLKGLAADCGMDPDRVSSHSMRAGRATTLYANGVGPMGIQRWGRWKSPVYMRYVWRENVRLRALSYALAKKTDLSTHLLAPEQKKRKVSFDTSYRCGGKTKVEPNEKFGEEEVADFDQVMSEFDHEMWSLTEGEKKRELERMDARRERREANKGMFRKKEEKREKCFVKEMKEMKQEKEE